MNGAILRINNYSGVFLHTDKSFFVHKITYLVFSSSLLMQEL